MAAGQRKEQQAGLPGVVTAPVLGVDPIADVAAVVYALVVTNAQIADCTNEKFIKSLGVRNFDVCIVAIGSDFQSSCPDA